MAPRLIESVYTTNLAINQANKKKKYFPKFSYPKKIPKPKILNPQKSFDAGHLKSGVPPKLKLQKVPKSISYCELEE